MKVGDKVIISKVHWLSDENNIFGMQDAEGLITSVSGVSENHTNIHKYEVTHSRGRYYTDNKNGEIFKSKN